MSQTGNNTPLVSVVVITYNSSATVVETLESIKKQTYPNIELIVTDDCSKDDTVRVSQQWIASNDHRFVRTLIVKSDKNTGVSPNCNRGWKKAEGKWIKFIAGDDRLLPNCIMDYIDYIQSNKEARIIFSKVVPIGNIEEGKKWPWLDVSLLFQELSQKQFRILLCRGNFLPAASAIMCKKVLQDLDGYDESIPLLEDWPFWMKATNSGYKLSFMNKETTEYRFGDASISQRTPSKQYIESSIRCAVLGKHFLRNISLLSRFYFFTMKHANKNILMRILHCFNILNPFYYEYYNSFKRFEVVKTEILNNIS